MPPALASSEKGLVLSASRDDTPSVMTIPKWQDLDVLYIGTLFTMEICWILCWRVLLLRLALHCVTFRGPIIVISLHILLPIASNSSTPSHVFENSDPTTPLYTPTPLNYIPLYPSVSDSIPPCIHSVPHLYPHQTSLYPHISSLYPLPAYCTPPLLHMPTLSVPHTPIGTPHSSLYPNLFYKSPPTSLYPNVFYKSPTLLSISRLTYYSPMLGALDLSPFSGVNMMSFMT